MWTAVIRSPTIRRRALFMTFPGFRARSRMTTSTTRAIGTISFDGIMFTGYEQFYGSIKAMLETHTPVPSVQGAAP